MHELAVSAERFADEKADFHPKSWLCNYRRTSLGYLTKMLLFYHGIGLALVLAGTAIIELVIPDYEDPSLPRSLFLVLAAGPIEETIFFGIPFYVFGSAYSVLVTGSVWVAIHLFNTSSFDVNSLAFGNVLFVLPNLFFSLRTWVSGKGWFSVLTHSAWNGIFFAAGCAAGEITCTAVGGIELTVTFLLASAGLVAATYVLYKRKENKERQRLAA